MFVQQFSGDCLPVYHLEFPANTVDHIALSLGIERQALNIVASPKGLIYADLTLTTKAGQVLEFSKANGVSIIFSVTNDNTC